MEYYKPHSICLNNNYGEIKIKCDEYYVNNIKIENNRALDGDIVYYNEIVLGIKKRSNELICGILHLNKNQKYGFTKRNVPYYKFSSISHRFPNFIVPSKTKLRKAIYCVIKLNKWETNNKHPIGQIEYIIGEIGNLDNEIDSLLYHTKLIPKKRKFIYHNPEPIKIDSDYNTISIDPPNCKDIDDALHFRENNDITEIGIHIANVARHINALDTNYYSTIYLDNKQINMLDDQFTYDHCSLGNGVKKKALSLILKYKNNKIIDHQFKETIVINKSFTYQDVDLLIKNKKIANITNLFNFSQKLDKSIINSGKMIEYFMILYNKIMAKTLYNYDVKTILRTHKKNDNENNYNNQKLNNYLDKINQNAALYQSNPENHKHEYLNLEFYTHGTSPIRRYVDIINQINIINLIEKKPIMYISNLDLINKFQKNLRKFYNYYKKLKIIFDMKETKNYECFIINIENKKISVFIPDLDLEHTFIIISKKLWENNNIIETHNSIEINDTKFNQFDKIDIKLTPLQYEEKFNKKLNIEIIKPKFKIL